VRTAAESHLARLQPTQGWLHERLVVASMKTVQHFPGEPYLARWLSNVRFSLAGRLILQLVESSEEGAHRRRSGELPRGEPEEHDDVVACKGSLQDYRHGSSKLLEQGHWCQVGRGAALAALAVEANGVRQQAGYDESWAAREAWRRPLTHDEVQATRRYSPGFGARLASCSVYFRACQCECLQAS
jgi:hypothetical protein